MNLRTAPSVVFRESRGQVKVTMQTLDEFDYDQLVIARVYLLDETNPEQACGDSTPKCVVDGSVAVLQKFAFDYDGEKFLRCEIVNTQDEELAHGQAPLDILLTEGEDRRAIELSPQGRMTVEMIWDQAPTYCPARICISSLGIQGLPSAEEGSLDPHILVKVATNTEETEIGRTHTARGAGGTADFSSDILDGAYSGQSELVFTIFNKDIDPIGEAVFDLWAHIKEKGAEASPLGKLALDCGGYVLFTVRCYDPDPEPEEEPFVPAGEMPDSHQRHSGVSFADVPPQQKPRGLPQRSTSSSSRSSSPSSSRNHNPLPNDVALRKALDDAERAAAAAEADAQKAKNVTDLIQDLSPKGDDGADAARDIRKAAAAAAERAADARQIANSLAANPPGTQAKLDQAVRDATKAAMDARTNADKARQRAKEAAAVSAREYAKAARESARQATGFADDTRGIAARYPTGHKSKQIAQLAAEATNASQDADDNAIEANQAARNAEAAPELHDALEAVKRAKKNAIEAKENEKYAEDRWREALKRARKIDRAKEGEAARQAQQEQEAREQAARRKEEARAAEHEADMQWRMRQLANPGDASEPVVYQEVVAYSFHSPNAVDSNNLQPATNRFNLCCAPPQAEYGIGTRKGSADSLVIQPPMQEIRGDGTQPNSYPPVSVQLAHAQIVEDSGNDDGGLKYLNPIPAPDSPNLCLPLLEGDGLVETIFMRRARCWCFGCGCMRCCGEC